MHDLKPQLTPGRKYFWVRFKHPGLKREVRVDLGSDENEAQEICRDLMVILKNRSYQIDPQCTANDGLHPVAVREYFRLMEFKVSVLRLENITQQLKLIETLIHRSEILSGHRWLVSQDSAIAIGRKRLDKRLGLTREQFQDYYPDEPWEDETKNPVV